MKYNPEKIDQRNESKFVRAGESTAESSWERISSELVLHDVLTVECYSLKKTGFLAVVYNH